jgi:hypothetical protein
MLLLSLNQLWAASKGCKGKKIQCLEGSAARFGAGVRDIAKFTALAADSGKTQKFRRWL